MCRQGIKRLLKTRQVRRLYNLWPGSRSVCLGWRSKLVFQRERGYRWGSWRHSEEHRGSPTRSKLWASRTHSAIRGIIFLGLDAILDFLSKYSQRPRIQIFFVSRLALPSFLDGPWIAIIRLMRVLWAWIRGSAEAEIRQIRETQKCP